VNPAVSGEDRTYPGERGYSSVVQALEEKYGAGSSKVKVATQLVKDTIKQVRQTLRECWVLNEFSV